jgi:outer membrane receptor protein involved in Fe transport
LKTLIEKNRFMDNKITFSPRLIIIAFFLTLVSGFSFAQNGEIKGKVTDQDGKPIGYASVRVMNGDVLKGGVYTEDDGTFTVKPLDAGSYTVKIKFTGYPEKIIEQVGVNAGKQTYIPNDQLQLKKGVDLSVVTVKYVKPIVQKDQTSTGNDITGDDIRKMATRNVTEAAVATTTGTYQKEGQGAQIKGARANGTRVFIDGVQVRGNGNVPVGSVENVTVITGGLPARFGDAIGGVISITTKGAAKRFSAGGELVTSYLLDKYGYNLASLNVTGPLLFDKGKNSKNKRPLLGYNLSLEYEGNRDGSPSAVGIWRVKPDALANIEANPLTLNPKTGFGYIRTADFLTKDDMELIKYKLNAVSNEVRGAARLDWNLNDNMYFAFGGNGVYNKRHDYIREYALFNYENNPFIREYTWRAFARFTHKLDKVEAPKEGEQAATRKQSAVISKAYYTIQADYSQNNFLRMDDSHKKNAFDYGYVGKFNTKSVKGYSFFAQRDSVSGALAILQDFDRDTLITFEPGTLNPKMTRYTELYFDEVGETRSNIYNANLNFVRLGGALVNGQRPGDVNSLWYGTGRQYGGYDYNQNNQFRVSLDASFDFKPLNSKTPHSIEFGAVYEQRVDRTYSVSALGLWTQMRLLANRQIASLDKANPIFKFVNGVFQDTIEYNRKYVAADHSRFDKNLRKKLGYSETGTEVINIDALDPAILSLDMFSADELINNGDNYIAYSGYTYDGKTFRGSPAFNEFFTAKNDNGDFTREIGANRPDYMAFYLQDKFSFSDLIFNVGLRVDRYDGNTKVLKDPYSLYEIVSKGEVAGKNNILNNGRHPDNIGDDYAVYVTDRNAALKDANVIGYRNGDVWYDASGVELQDPKPLAQATVDNKMNPLLKDPSKKITDKDFDPSTSFADFQPQYNVMPRIAFSFPINDNANFFAHYDILTQRPQSRTLLTPDNYLYLEKNATDVTFNNPNLKAEKVVDYQIGYNQAIGRNAGIKVSSFYREYKDMIQVVQVNYAYPVSYRTYGNKDFATVKGFEFSYEHQGLGNVSFTTGYTLSFADGTGSDDRSQANLINQGVPNLKAVLPLSFDVRHTFNGVFDFRYKDGKEYNGPKIRNKKIFANAGVNLTSAVRSGEPYSRNGNVRNEALISPTGSRTLAGTINGSRLPWNYKFDLRVDKDFLFKGKSKNEGKTKKEFGFNAYVQVLNLLNTKNTQNIYSYTGTSNDDGYIGSPQSQSLVNNQLSPEGFVDQYLIKVNNPSNYSLPRRIRVGIIFHL